MRQIGKLPNENQARKFSDYLLTLGVKSQFEDSGQDWDIWIYDEDRIDQAKEELAVFAAHPDEPRYVDATASASSLRQDEKQKVLTARKNLVDVRKKWQRPVASQCPVTFGLMAISVAVAVFADLGGNRESILTALRITPPLHQGEMHDLPDLIASLRSGQVWRLITPIFAHASIVDGFGFLHILFNMMWMRELGMAIEVRKGSTPFALMVLGIAVTSNVAQYLQSGPNFYGMSGVVFGLFGYIWIKGKFDPTETLHMPQQTVFWMMGWFVLCTSGAVGNIANMAHGVGLVTGMAMGYAASQLRGRWANR